MAGCTLDLPSSSYYYYRLVQQAGSSGVNKATDQRMEGRRYITEAFINPARLFARPETHQLFD